MAHEQLADISMTFPRGEVNGVFAAAVG